MVGVTRTGHARIVGPQMTLQEGDQVHLAVDENGPGAAPAGPGGPPGRPGRARRGAGSPPVRVAIAGAGNVGQFIAADLRWPPATR